MTVKLCLYLIPTTLADFTCIADKLRDAFGDLTMVSFRQWGITLEAQRFEMDETQLSVLLDLEDNRKMARWYIESE